MIDRRFAWVALFAVLGCGRDAAAPDNNGSPNDPSSPLFTNGSICPTYSGVPGLARACMFDSNGKTYAEDGTLYAFPAAPPYGAMFVFTADAIPAAVDVTTAGSNASIGVFAAPYDVNGRTQCCAEDSEGNRISARATIDESGVLTISIPSAVPTGYQIAITLNFGKLYASRISPPGGGACDLPNAEMCTQASSLGFAMRFYVEMLPSDVVPKGTSDASPAADGTCLLSYNTALVADGASDCCYRQGGANTCDVAIKCNEVSGGDCCLIYGTESTSYGEHCCLYATGRNVDGAEECAQLLAAGR